jgi:HD superfamily phosphohydrolase
LLWDNHFKEKSLPFKFSALMTEKTLYHEIGHHAYRHTFDQHTSDKEKEADRYAYKIMKQNHPYLHIIARILNKFGFKCERNYYRWGL